MSSPYDARTKRGTEETLEAIDRAQRWISRIDTSNDATNLDASTFLDELSSEEDRLREKYRIKTTEVAVDNFVFNNESLVEDILCGDLDEKVAALDELESYINDDFGRENPYSLSKEELAWLVAQEVKSHVDSSTGLDIYSEEPVRSVDLDDVGSQPDVWSEGFPQQNN